MDVFGLFPSTSMVSTIGFYTKARTQVLQSNTRNWLILVVRVSSISDKLGKVVDAYNQAIGSMESRLMPALRKLKESAVASEDAPALEPLEQNPRLPLDAGE